MRGFTIFFPPDVLRGSWAKRSCFGDKPLSLSGESAYGEYAWGRIRMWERTHARQRMGERLSCESTFGVRARRSVARLVQDESLVDVACSFVAWPQLSLLCSKKVITNYG